MKEVEFRHEARLICAPGSVLKGNICVKCPVGTYWNSTTLSCDACPIGHYQPHEGSVICLSCPSGTSTRRIQAKNLRDCRPLCPPGCFGRKRKHWKSHYPGLTPCTTCEHGSYQPKPGQTECWHCPGNWTTVKRGSTHVHDCKAFCPPGEISESGLVPCMQCPVGYRQSHSGQKFCVDGEGEKLGAECLSLPCQNGGLCLSLGSQFFTCDCPPGFLGSFCETQVKECVSDPCLHGGTCVDIEPAQYNCSCVAGYSGANCEIDIDECTLSPCQNGATCIDGILNFSCLCAEGFQGQLCEENIDECTVEPCLFNSTCVDGIANYSCVCLDGYSGKHCEVEPYVYDPCDNEPCYNGAICVSNGHNYSCICSEGFEGKDCNINTDDCANNPCINNGTCIDKIAEYKCLCKTQYTGEHCETKLPSEYFLRFPSSGTTDYVLMKGPYSPLTQVSICLWLKSADSFNYGTVFSYATNVSDNSFTLTDYNGFVLYVNGERIVTDITANDGLWHSLCVMWHSSNGEWSIYMDGKLGDNGTGLANGTFIPGDGILILGQEQDLMGSGFSEAESFMGYLSSVVMWDYILQVTQVWDLTMLCDSVSSLTGNLFVWTDFLKGIHGDIKIEKSSFCTECATPAAPFQGSVNISSSIEEGMGSVAVYTCNKGFSLQWGSQTHRIVERKCLKQGAWEGPTPFCIRKSCGFPGYFPKGVVRGRSYLYTDTIHYFCNRGYKQIGNNVRVCMANGKWSGEVPVCEGKSCEAISPPEYGRLRSLLLESGEAQWNSSMVLQYGHQVEVECDVGFQLEGANVLTCLEDGQWDELMPICRPVGCKNAPTFPLAVNRSPIKEVYDFGEKLNYECVTGYISQQKNVVICTEDGTWKKHVDCVLIECPEPQTLEHGEISLLQVHNSSTTNISKNTSATYVYGSKIEVSCELGYRLIGPSVQQCLLNGTWSSSGSHCEQIKCNISELPTNESILIQNGYFNISGNNFRDLVTFKCSTGYKFLYASVLEEIKWICNANGSWDLLNFTNILVQNDHPLCQLQVFSCPEPKDPANGYILREESIKNFTIGSMIKMKCRLGYILQGSNISTCSEEGQWSHDNTTCAPVQCQNPPAPLHTALTNAADVYVYGNMLNFHCIEGYQAYGILTSRCLANGKWSRVRGKCARISCGKPPMLEGATIIGNSYLYQDQVVYNCPAGTKAIPQSTVTCLSNGTWSGTPSCEKL